MRLAWQERRDKFNHSWMKNTYIPNLGAWLNLLDDKIEDYELESSFVGSILPSWGSHANEALSLIDDFETEMSPRTLFNQHPLSNCDDDTKKWLGELIHNLWLERYSIKALITNANIHHNATIVAYEQLHKALSNCSNTCSVVALKPYRDLFSNLLVSCRAFSEAIEEFSSEVKPV